MMNEIFNTVFAKHMKAMYTPYSQWTVDDWLEFDVSDSEKRKYKNAKKAVQIKNCKLNKILG